MADNHTCQRCGLCCKDIGTIWVQSTHPLIKVIYKCLSPDYFTDIGVCLMLMWENGKAVCLLEKHLSRNAKPEVCREYPNDEPCFRQKEEQNNEIE